MKNTAKRSSGLRGGQLIVVALPALWLCLFFLAPLALVAKISLSETARAIPPYAPHWAGWAELPRFISELGFSNFALLFSDSLYIHAYLSSLRLAAITTLVALLIGFPLAIAVSHAPRRWQGVLMVLIILPFWTSFLIRVYAWIGILKPAGYLEQVLQALGIISAPLNILNTDTAVVIGMVYSYLPFMVLPIYAALDRLDGSLLEAAADLGAPTFTRFRTITVPLATPGLLAGSLLVFIPSIGEFVVPDLLGGADTLMIGKVLWTEFFSNRDWPVASAVAMVLLAVMLVPVLFFQRAMTGGSARR